MTDSEHSQVYADIMSQLMQSDRFNVFFATNFDLKKEVDDEAKTITYLVIEVPPEVVIARLKAKAKEVDDQKNKITSLDTGLTIATSLKDVEKHLS